ncbi:hypothetical protein BN3660_03733 [Eubacteriaceae bacterium CHKCI004]|nr:hypothetical protein BN3660_03733 [Eubacteriaceae bacterium CHKCI004]
MSKGSKYSQQFNEDAVRYKKSHTKLTAKLVTDNLGVSESSFKHWIHSAKINNGSVFSPGIMVQLSRQKSTIFIMN